MDKKVRRAASTDKRRRGIDDTTDRSVEGHAVNFRPLDEQSGQSSLGPASTPDKRKR